MAPAAKRRAETGLHRCTRKHLATSNKQWLHLSAGDVGVMDSLQSLMGSTSLVCTILNFQLAMALAVESVADGNTDMAAVNSVIDAVAMNLTTFLGLMGAWTAADSMLFDIPHHEDEMTRQFAAPTNLRINNFTDTACHKMTHFFHGQLRQLYTAFDLEGYLVQLNVDMLPFYTGYTFPKERQSVLLQDPPRGGVPFHDDKGSYGSVKSADHQHVHWRQPRSFVGMVHAYVGQKLLKRNTSLNFQ